MIDIDAFFAKLPALSREEQFTIMCAAVRDPALTATVIKDPRFDAWIKANAQWVTEYVADVWATPKERAA